MYDATPCLLQAGVEGYTNQRWLMAAKGFRGNAMATRRARLPACAMYADSSETAKQALAANSKAFIINHG